MDKSNTCVDTNTSSRARRCATVFFFFFKKIKRNKDLEERYDALVDLAQSAFERWHQRLVESCDQYDGAWTIRIMPPIDSEIKHGQSLVLGLYPERRTFRSGQSLSAELWHERCDPDYRVAWNLRSYLDKVGQDEECETLWGHSRAALLPNFEGKYAHDLALLATVGVRYELRLATQTEKYASIRKRFRPIEDGFSWRIAWGGLCVAFDMARDWYYQRADFRDTNCVLERMAQFTREYLHWSESCATAYVNRCKRFLAEIEQSIIPAPEQKINPSGLMLAIEQDADVSDAESSEYEESSASSSDSETE